MQLYHNVIEPNEAKLNQLSVVRIAAAVAKQYYPSQPFVEAGKQLRNLVGPSSHHSPELHRAKDFVASLCAKKEQLGAAAELVCKMEVVSIRLLFEDATALKTEIEAAVEQIAEFEGEDPIVPATVYRVASEYFKSAGPAANYYQNALKYLTHVDLDTLTTEARVSHGRDVALAALVGDGIFNFGELVTHPIIHTLESSDFKWLADLLHALHHGDIRKFSLLWAEQADVIDEQPALITGEGVIKEKAALLCLIEIASRKPAAERYVHVLMTDVSTLNAVPRMRWCGRQDAGERSCGSSERVASYW